MGEVADFLTLDVFAEITARVDAGKPKDEVLREKGVSLQLFEREQRRWLSDIEKQVARQRYDLQRRFSDAYARYRLAAEPLLKAPVASGAGRSAEVEGAMDSYFMPKPIVLPPVAPPEPVTPAAVLAPAVIAPARATPPVAPPPIASPPVAPPPIAPPPVVPPLAAAPPGSEPTFRPVAPPPVVPAVPAHAPHTAGSADPYAPQAFQAPAAAQTFAAQPGAKLSSLNSTAAFRVMPGAFGNAFRVTPAGSSPSPQPAAPQPMPQPAPAQAAPPVAPPAHSPQAPPAHAAQAASPPFQGAHARPPHAPAPLVAPSPPSAPNAIPQAFFVSSATLAGQGAPPAGQGPAPSAPALSLEQHACLRAELELQPQRAGQIYQAYLVDEASYRAQLAELNQRLSQDPAMVERFRQLCQYYRAIMAPRG